MIYLKLFIGIGSLSAALSCAVFSISNEVWSVEQRAFTNQDELELSIFSMDQIMPILPLMQEWAEREFIQYPYLWAPPKGEIFAAFAFYPNERNAMVATVKNQGKVVGIAAGVAFDCEAVQSLFGQLQLPAAPLFVDVIRGKGFDPSRILYMSLFLTAPECRNDERLVSLIYNQFVDFAHKIGKDQICYFEDIGNLARKPESPVPIEPWGSAITGFRSMNIQLDIAWETLQIDGSIKDEVHTSEFFIKDL